VGAGGGRGGSGGGGGLGGCIRASCRPQAARSSHTSDPCCYPPPRPTAVRDTKTGTAVRDPASTLCGRHERTEAMPAGGAMSPERHLLGFSAAAPSAPAGAQRDRGSEPGRCHSSGRRRRRWAGLPCAPAPALPCSRKHAQLPQHADRPVGLTAAYFAAESGAKVGRARLQPPQPPSLPQGQAAVCHPRRAQRLCATAPQSHCRPRSPCWSAPRRPARRF
jgi:hypothetical protein